MADDRNGSPDLQTDNKARDRDRLHRRIRNIRQHNRHLTIAQIAGNAGVSAAYVKDALGLPQDFPNDTAAARTDTL